MPERAAGVWGDALAKGSANRAADLGPLEICAGGVVAIGDGLESFRDLGRPMVALYVGGMGARGRNFYNDLARRYGYEKEAELIQDLYLDGKKDEAAAAVPAELLEKTTLIGSEGFVKERIAAFREAGVTVLNLLPVGPDPLRTIEQVKSWVS
jgi:alkanesulfonate monooxygenase SsuD/methylene tetrahydromethanopterin reductase-like flavin-dependent oxidoreductase (luciferase family)